LISYRFGGFCLSYQPVYEYLKKGTVENFNACYKLDFISFRSFDLTTKKRNYVRDDEKDFGKCKL
jgi:hypothetical protein